MAKQNQEMNNNDEVDTADRERSRAQQTDFPCNITFKIVSVWER